MAAKTKNKLRFSTPAKWWGSSWREALNAGNGRIGVSVLGGASEESIMFTHADLWWQGKVGVLPDVCDNLGKVRSALNECKYKDAVDILPSALVSKGYNPSVSYPLPMCDLKIRQKCDKPPKEYYREVDLESGEITVSYKDGATRFERCIFVSKTSDMVAFELKKIGQKLIDADFSLELHEKFNTLTPSAKSNLPEGVQSKAEGKYLSFSARNENGEFGAIGYVNFSGGAITNTENAISIRGAEKVFIVFKLFVGAKNKDIKMKEIKDSLKGFKLTYDKLYKEHASAFSRVFERAYITLDDDDSCIDKLITQNNQSGEMPAVLIEKLWGYGRYLFLSSTTPSSAPVTPYGIWCGDFKGVNSHLNADGTMQLMYEHATQGNLTDYFDSLLDHYKNVFDDLKKNAIRLYNARGIMIPSVMARGTGLIGSVDPAVVHFTGAAGWLCKLFYEASLCASETKWLKSEVVPFLKETAQFYLEFFSLSSSGFFECSPSYVPNGISNPDNAKIAKNALSDFYIARSVFENLIEISDELGLYKAEIPKWQDFLTKIPPIKFNQDGTIKEYNDPKAVENIKNGSTALFYPVFPSTQVNDFSGDIFKQFEKTARERFAYGNHHSSATLAKYANLFVRLNQPKIAEDIMSALVSNCAYSNLIFSLSDWTGMGIANNDNWAQFSIEPNLILTNTIQEMFLRSDKDTVWLLPACGIPKGEIGGFLTKCGVEVLSLEWDLKKGNVVAKLKAKKKTTVKIKLPEQIKKLKGVGTVDTVDPKVVNQVELPNGKTITFEFKI
ncbi:MAG: glycoside hydrolase family 95 protein [Firmicutes bacterium]|nr:glycoside hydrolase family 95 protein [Bacillota bacterium]